MDFLIKNKILVGAIVVIVVVLGAVFVFTRSKGAQTAPPAGDQTQNVKKLSPQDIGLTLSLRADKRAVEMEIGKLTGVKSIQYEADYNANAKDPDTGELSNVPRGVVSSDIDVSGQSDIKKEILLGTCSSGTCKYDDVTSDIKFILKIVYDSGEVASVTDSIPFK